MPKFPDFDTDDAISAELDGEFDAYAIELGVDPGSLRAQMTARPEYSGHAAALAAAQGAMATPVIPLDDVSRARLLSAATQGGTSSDSLTPSRSRGQAWNARLAVAAAILVVVLGGGVLLITGGGDDGSAKSASTSAAPDQCVWAGRV